MTNLGTPVACSRENQPHAGLLVMPPRMTFLVSMSHSGTFSPSRAREGSAFTWDTSWLPGEQ